MKLLVAGVSSLHGGASVKGPTCQCRRCKRFGFAPWVGKIPWKRKWQLTPIFLPKKSHGQMSLVDYSPWDCKRVGHNWVHTHTHTHTHTHGCFTNLYVFLQWNESVIRNSSFLDLSPTHQPYPSRSPQSTELSSLYSRFPLAVSNMAVHIRPSQSPNSSPPCPPVTWNTSKHLIFWSHCHWCHSY